MRPRDFRFALSPLLAALAVLTMLGAASAGSRYSYSSDNKDRFGFALFHDDGNGSTVMTGFGDWDAIERLRKDDEPLLVFKMDGRRGVIRNPKLIQRADEACEEMIALGEEQGRLGERQGRLGEVQGRLGERQGELGERQAEASIEMQEIALEISRAVRRGESTRSLEKKRMEIEEEIEDLSVEQRALGHQQSLLGAQQSALGKKQSELGARQTKASERARIEVKDLVAEAIRDDKVEWVN